MISWAENTNYETVHSRRPLLMPFTAHYYQNERPNTGETQWEDKSLISFTHSLHAAQGSKTGHDVIPCGRNTDALDSDTPCYAARDKKSNAGLCLKVRS